MWLFAKRETGNEKAGMGKGNRDRNIILVGKAFLLSQIVF